MICYCVNFLQTGRQAIHWACVGGKKEIVDFLIAEYNVPLDVADEAGWTPLIISSSVGNNDLVKLLLEHGCNPNNVTEMKKAKTKEYQNKYVTKLKEQRPTNEKR